MDSSKIGLTVLWGGDANPSTVERGDIIVVRVTYPFQLVTAPLLIADNTIPMSSTTRTLAVN